MRVICLIWVSLMIASSSVNWGAELENAWQKAEESFGSQSPKDKNPTPLDSTDSLDAVPAVPSGYGGRSDGFSIGLALGGGGTFGAWEIGALKGFFDSWRKEHGEDPPIRVVAGTSVGALIAPFALLGREAVEEGVTLFQSIKEENIMVPRGAAALPLPLFAGNASSLFVTGFRQDGQGTRLYGFLQHTISDQRLEAIGRAWPHKRMAVTTTDYGSGKIERVTNRPEDIQWLRKGIYTSAMIPTAMPPVKIPGKWDTPHFDGGIVEQVPIESLLELSSQTPPIQLTHIIVLSPFPEAPGKEEDMVQKRLFPKNPRFASILKRTQNLSAEQASKNAIRIARLAIALRKAGVDEKSVYELSGLKIPLIPELVVLTPENRLGWEALKFDRRELTEMCKRGYSETCKKLDGVK